MSARGVGRRVLRGLAAVDVALAVHTAVNVALLRTPPPDPPATTARVRVVVPARDEEHQLGGCLAALAAQTGVPQLQVVVVDDDSADGTAGVAQAAGAEVRPAGTAPAGLAGQTARLRAGGRGRRGRRRPGVRRRRRPAGTARRGGRRRTS